MLIIVSVVIKIKLNKEIKIITNRWQLKRLHSEPASHLTENQNKMNMFWKEIYLSSR